LDAELGSLKAGELADLVVLDRDPLKDIRNTDSVRYVMKNGELFDAENMDKLWPNYQLRPAFRWQSH
jgi:imidazolonepropionase-like amidohydrolase